MSEYEKNVRVVSEPVTEVTAETVLGAIDDDTLMRVEAFDVEKVGDSGDLWERIKQFNQLFDYKEGDDLSLWHTIMEEQVDEIAEHLEEGREDKALNEFIDCILVGQQAGLLASDEDVDELLMDRIHDIEERVDSVQKEYRAKHEGVAADAE